MRVFDLALLFMSWAKPGEAAVISSRAYSIAFHAHEVVQMYGPIFDGEDGEDRSEELVVRIAFLESRGDPKAVSPDGRDVGVLQCRDLLPEERKLVLGSVPHGMACGYEKLLHMRGFCRGPAIKWLGAYASGKCGGAASVARVRCGPLGLCDRT